MSDAVSEEDFADEDDDDIDDDDEEEEENADFIEITDDDNEGGRGVSLRDLQGCQRAKFDPFLSLD